jgi:hypothetical protein
MIKKICKILLLVLILTSVSLNKVSADYNCGQFTDSSSCEDRTSRGCSWITGSCVYNAENANSSESYGTASDTFGSVDPLQGKFDSVGSIISTLLPYLFSIAGLILFGMLIMGGFEMMTAGTDAKKADAGKTRITSAIIGFAIIFAAYWIAQILQIVLGVSILK